MTALRVLALLCFGACSPPPAQPGQGTAPTAAACARPGQQCALGGGALGICERRPEGGYQCMPQH